MRHARFVQTFVVKIWLESEEDALLPGEWRGEARDVLSGRIVYFRHLEGIAEAIRRLGALSDIDEASQCQDEG
jgi:hypothetical protein